MIILTLRTDKPLAELGLYDDRQQLAYETWEAHRQLAETLNQKIEHILQTNHQQLKSIAGVVMYGGPGSFTGLRIGLSVGNALAYALDAPSVGATGDDWVRQGIDRLLSGSHDAVVVPDYGAPVHITQQKK